VIAIQKKEREKEKWLSIARNSWLSLRRDGDNVNVKDSSEEEEGEREGELVRVTSNHDEIEETENEKDKDRKKEQVIYTGDRVKVKLNESDRKIETERGTERETKLEGVPCDLEFCGSISEQIHLSISLAHAKTIVSKKDGKESNEEEKQGETERETGTETEVVLDPCLIESIFEQSPLISQAFFFFFSSSSTSSPSIERESEGDRQIERNTEREKDRERDRVRETMMLIVPNYLEIYRYAQTYKLSFLPEIEKLLPCLSSSQSHSHSLSHSLPQSKLLSLCLLSLC
jgi:hypothetical protein